MKRRTFLQLTAAGCASFFTPVFAASGVAAKPGADFELEELTIADLQTRMESGRCTAVSLARSYLERIEKVDQRGPMLRSIIELNPDALKIARELDRERKAKRVRSSLHGIPVLLKDNIDTHDRMMCTAGSLALMGSHPLSDVARRVVESSGSAAKAAWSAATSKPEQIKVRGFIGVDSGGSCAGRSALSQARDLAKAAGSFSQLLLDGIKCPKGISSEKIGRGNMPEIHGSTAQRFGVLVTELFGQAERIAPIGLKMP
jgi:hypothetical protein